MFTRTALGLLFAAGLTMGGVGVTTTTASADSFRHHPPGPDRCWAWHHHHWIWVCHRPYDWHHPELSFYIGPIGHRHHHDRHDGDWNNGDNDHMMGGKDYRKHDDNGGDNSSSDWKKKHPGQ
jgi:hypothetical protein